MLEYRFVIVIFLVHFFHCVWLELWIYQLNWANVDDDDQRSVSFEQCCCFISPMPFASSSCKLSWIDLFMCVFVFMKLRKITYRLADKWFFWWNVEIPIWSLKANCFMLYDIRNYANLLSLSIGWYCCFLWWEIDFERHINTI